METRSRIIQNLIKLYGIDHKLAVHWTDYLMLQGLYEDEIYTIIDASIRSMSEPHELIKIMKAWRPYGSKPAQETSPS